MTSFYYPQIYCPPHLLSYPINQTNLLLFQFLGVGFSLFRTIVNFPFGSGRLLNKPTPYLHVQPSLSGFKTNNKRALIVILSTIILNSVNFYISSHRRFPCDFKFGFQKKVTDLSLLNNHSYWLYIMSPAEKLNFSIVVHKHAQGDVTIV